MSKKRSWLCFFKTLFFPETLHHHQDNKMSKRRIWAFGRLKRAITLPLTPPPYHIEKVEAEEKQSNFEEDHQKSQFQEEFPKSPLKDSTFGLIEQLETHLQNLAAIKIQTSYRAYLARKALRALKGFVKLQAIIRGRAVRRQTMTTLKCLQAIVNIQSDFCVKRSQISHIKCRPSHFLDFTDTKLPKEESVKHRRDDGLLSKVDEIDIILRKKEAILRRHRTKPFSLNHRHSTDSEESKTEGRLNYWLEQYLNDKNVKLKNTNVANTRHILSLPRRSLQNHRKQNSCGEDGFPTYMAATESARARTRSTSSPRVRLVHPDGYSDTESMYKYRLSSSPMASSITSEVTCSGFSRVSNKSTQYCYSNPPTQQKSPSLKGHFGHLKSSKVQEIS